MKIEQIYNDNFFSRHIPFEEAVEAEYCHTYASLIDCINNLRVKDICWLDDIGGNDEIINCTLNDSDKDFNILVAKSLFDYENFEKWCKKNNGKIWIKDKNAKTRGIDYFKMKVDLVEKLEEV